MTLQNVLTILSSESFWRVNISKDLHKKTKKQKKQKKVAPPHRAAGLLPVKKEMK